MMRYKIEKLMKMLLRKIEIITCSMILIHKILIHKHYLNT